MQNRLFSIKRIAKPAIFNKRIAISAIFNNFFYKISKLKKKKIQNQQSKKKTAKSAIFHKKKLQNRQFSLDQHYVKIVDCTQKRKISVHCVKEEVIVTDIKNQICLHELNGFPFGSQN